MSYGEFRATLLLRALVNDPQVLLLDEPFDGLDAAARSDFAEVLEGVFRSGASLVIVTHHPRDLPACMSHGLLLEKSRIVCQGELEKIQSHPAMLRLFGARLAVKR